MIDIQSRISPINGYKSIYRLACSAPIHQYLEESWNPLRVLWCTNGWPSYEKYPLESIFPPEECLGGERILNLCANCTIVEECSNLSFYLRLPFQFPPWHDFASDSTMSVPYSNALRRWSPMWQAWKWVMPWWLILMIARCPISISLSMEFTPPWTFACLCT